MFKQINHTGNKLDQLIFLIKKDIGLYLGISFGIFLFILFFQPFPIEKFDINNNLLFVAGLAAIIYLFLILIRIVLRWVSSSNEEIYLEPLIHSDVDDLIIWVLSSVSVAFYLRYVGSVSISFFIMFKIAFICFIPPLITRLYDQIKMLRQENESLVNEKVSILQKVEEFRNDYQNKSIEFSSDYGNEKLTLPIADVVLLKSADNYVEIIYLEENNLKKKLIRNTLRNIEQQIRPYSNFIRCHRTAIVNIYHIEELNLKYSNYFLSIREYDEQIPVSRQYLLKIRENI